MHIEMKLCHMDDIHHPGGAVQATGTNGIRRAIEMWVGDQLYELNVTESLLLLCAGLVSERRTDDALELHQKLAEKG